MTSICGQIFKLTAVAMKTEIHEYFYFYSNLTYRVNEYTNRIMSFLNQTRRQQCYPELKLCGLATTKVSQTKQSDRILGNQDKTFI